MSQRRRIFIATTETLFFGRPPSEFLGRSAFISVAVVVVVVVVVFVVVGVVFGAGKNK